MSKSTEEFWNIVFWSLIWIGLAIFFIWIFLKLSGIITSPIWIEIAPYIGGALTLLGAAYQLGKIKKSIDYTAGKVNATYSKLSSLEQNFTRLSHEHEIAMGRVNIKKH